MDFKIPPSVEYVGEKQNPFLEVLNTEKQLLALIYSKGLLDKEVQELYHKACSDFENIILNDYEVLKLQEVEYFLWKLHYMHIEEFRKRIRQYSADVQKKKAKPAHEENNAQVNLDRHMEGFRSFLSEATAFYENLIKKLRRSCGLPEDLILSGKTNTSFSVEPAKFNRTEYACHRFLICLGDIARYRELCKKPDARNWSLAATYYLEAARIWPDSGNPHNQLALLATYVGDSFLALYHCLRSLAVKEPFPDAWRNLMLLIEENKSSHLSLLSSKAHVDFSRPYERVFLEITSEGSNRLSSDNEPEATESISSSKTDVWPLFVRMISFFIVKDSMEDFPCSIASAIRELESLFKLDETKLQSALESYQLIDSSRRGPYRALQLVCIFIFVIHSLTEYPEREKLTERDEKQQGELAQLALATTFICLGRLTERCLKSKRPENCPLLPAVLEFVEWLVSMLDKVEEYAADEKVTSTMWYFFGVLADLLNQLDHGKGEVSADNTALWEDHESRGFEPMADTHVALNFSRNQECMNNFNCKNLDRSLRILHAATEIVQRSNKPRKWLLYDEEEKKFCRVEFMKFRGQEVEVMASNSAAMVKELQNQKCENDEGSGCQISSSLNHHSVNTEEEEVILFKPITRHNSAPIYSTNKSDLISEEGMEGKEEPSDECLRRVTSLISGQNQTGSFSFHSDATNFRGNKPLKHPDPLFKDSTTCAVGPPSLSAWVFNQESPKSERDQGLRSSGKYELSPIDELSSASFVGLTIDEAKDSISGSKQVSASAYNHSPAYIAPVPSAPLLPDDAVWFTGNSSSSHVFNRPVGSKEGDGILGASPISGYTNLSATRGPVDFGSRVSGFVDGYPPLLGMSSSEWLYHYRNSQNFDRVPHQVLPVHLNAPELLGTFHANDVSSFGPFDQWGNYLLSDPMVYLDNSQLLPTPLAFGPDVQQTEKLLPGYQRSSPYACRSGSDLRAEQPPLLQYLKEREWQVQRDPQFGGPTFMGK